MLVKFFILFVPFTISMWIFAPTVKWKVMFTIAGAIGIGIALAGKSMKGMTPLSRRGY